MGKNKDKAKDAPPTPVGNTSSKGASSGNLSSAGKNSAVMKKGGFNKK